MKLLFKIGPFGIHLFGLTIALGIIAGIYILLKEAKRKSIDEDKLTSLALYSVVIGIIGARINYIISFNLSYYLQNPREIFMITQGGLSIQGGLIAGITLGLWYLKKNSMGVWKTADAFAPAIILGQAIGRVGCDVFGIPMARAWFWGVRVGNELLHPAQIYEAVLNYLLFLFLWNKRKHVKYHGQLFFTYVIGFSINRFIVEFFRTNPMVAGPLSIAHMLSLLMIGGALVAMILIKKYGQMKQIDLKNNIDTLKIEWMSVIIVMVMIVVSLSFYYFIHSI